VPLVVDPVMIASSGAKLLQDDAVDTLVTRLFPLATVITPNLNEAVALAGVEAPRLELAERLHELGAAAVIVTGGHGPDAVDHLFDGRATWRSRSSATTSRRRTAPAARTPRRSPPSSRRAPPRGRRAHRRARRIRSGQERARRDRRRRRSGRRLPPERSRMTVSPGATLARLREQRPLVHQITNYVVMNETANATLALGALPVMAHAREEVEEMVGLAGRPRDQHRHALAARGSARCSTRASRRTHGDPGRRRPGRRRCDVVPNGHGEAAPRHRWTSPCSEETPARSRRSWASRPRCAASSRSAQAAIRPSSRARPRERSASSRPSQVPVDHVSNGETVLSVANGHELLATVTGTGCMSTAITGCFLAANGNALEAAAEALAAFGVAGEDAAKDAKGPRHVPCRALRRALQPRPGDARRAREDRVKLHALVEDVEAARPRWKAARP
jgi:hydroxyethylthiazole kinase